MSGCLLLVTGARSLAPRGEQWARELIRGAFAELSINIVVTGDASGPDAWALAEANALGMGTSVWHQKGPLAGWHCESWAEVERCWMPAHALAALPPARRPLERNKAMVVWVAAKRLLGHTATVLALLDPASRTHGTEHTATLAERAGLRVRREVFGR